MILADTGYFIAIANPKDHLHRRAVEWTLRLQESVLVTEYVLIEAVNAMSTRSLRSRCSELVEQIMQDATFVFLDASSLFLTAGLSLHQSRVDKEWSLTDCISFEVMRQRQIQKALSHDHHFVQAGFDALLQRDPS